MLLNSIFIRNKISSNSHICCWDVFFLEFLRLSSKKFEDCVVEQGAYENEDESQYNPADCFEQLFSDHIK